MGSLDPLKALDASSSSLIFRVLFSGGLGLRSSLYKPKTEEELGNYLTEICQYACALAEIDPDYDLDKKINDFNVNRDISNYTTWTLLIIL